MKRKNEIGIIRSVADAFNDNSVVNQTLISVDNSGNVIIEGFKKLLDYSINGIKIKAQNKILYIYGENIVISSCTKHNAIVSGKVNKIEIFEGE